jgi:hypothetical protein
MATLDIPATVVGTGIYTTLVPDADCLLTNDGDTSYMEENVSTAGGSAGYNDNIHFAATTIPGTVTSVSLVTVTKGSDSTLLPRGQGGVAFALHGFDWYWQGIFADGATDWTEIVTPLIFGGVERVTQAMIEAGTVEYASGHALLNDTIFPGSGTAAFDSLWTYIALRVTYDGEAVTTGIPPRRIFQRTDGKTHGAPRLFGNR